MKISVKVKPKSKQQQIEKLVKGLTIALWLLPLFLGLFAIVSREWLILIIFPIIIILYGSVWLWCYFRRIESKP